MDTTQLKALKTSAVYALIGAAWMTWRADIDSSVGKLPELPITLPPFTGWYLLIASTLFIYYLTLRLLRQRTLLAHALERVSDGFVALDRNWRYTHVNQQAAKMLQRDRPEDLLGKHIWTEHPEDVGKPLHAAYLKAMETQQPVTLEQYYPHWDQWFENYIYPSKDGLSIFCANITERKQAEADLQQSELRFRDTFEQAAVGIAHVAPNGHWLHANQQLCDIVDYSHSELMQLSFQDITHPDDLDADLSQVQRMLTGEIDTYEMEKRYYRKDGGIIWVNLTVSLIRNARHEPDYFISVIEDISSRKSIETMQNLNNELEQRVAARTTELEAINSELRSFTYSVAHDLRAPLRHIDGYSEILLEECASRLKPEDMHYLGKIRANASKMRLMMDDLLVYSRLEQSSLHYIKISLNALLRSLLLEFEDDIARTGAEIQLAVDTIQVMSDRDGLNMALRNLLENALKFHAADSPPRIKITASAEADETILTVSDQGVGFDMQYYNNIFTLFQRLHREEDFPGSGVGLALVRKAIQRMGGRVWAESVPNQGSSFYLAIPKELGSEAP